MTTPFSPSPASRGSIERPSSRNSSSSRQESSSESVGSTNTPSRRNIRSANLSRSKTMSASPKLTTGSSSRRSLDSSKRKSLPPASPEKTSTTTTRSISSQQSTPSRSLLKKRPHTTPRADNKSMDSASPSKRVASHAKPQQQPQGTTTTTRSRGRVAAAIAATEEKLSKSPTPPTAVVSSSSSVGSHRSTRSHTSSSSQQRLHQRKPSSVATQTHVKRTVSNRAPPDAPPKSPPDAPAPAPKKTETSRQEEDDDDDDEKSLVERLRVLDAPVSPPRPENQACLNASLTMLHTAMDDNAKAYEYLFSSSTTTSNATKNPAGEGTEVIVAEDAIATTTGQNKPWLSMLQQIHSKRAQETSQLRRDLQQAEARSKQYKKELRENLSERLQFLEDRVLHQVSADSSNATAATSQSSENGSLSSWQQQHQQQHILPQQLQLRAHPDPEPTHPEQQLLLLSQEHQQHQEVKDQLEKTQKEFTREKREWLRRLDVLEGRYSADLESWQKEVAQLKDGSRQLLEERNKLSAQLAKRMESDNERLVQTTQERDDAVQLLGQMQEEFDCMQKELDQAQTTAVAAKRGARAAKKMYKEELKALDEPIADVEAVYKDSVEKRNELVSRLRQLESQHADDKATWKLQLECALANAHNASAEMAQVREKRKVAEQETEQLKLQNAELQGRLETLETDHNALQTEQKRLQKETEQQKRENAELQSRLQQQQEQVQGQQKRSTKEVERLKSANKELNSQLEEVGQQLQQERDQHKLSSTELEEWKHQHADLNSQLKEANQQLEQERQHHKLSATELEEWKHQHVDLERKLEQVEQQHKQVLAEKGKDESKLLSQLQQAKEQNALEGKQHAAEKEDWIREKSELQAELEQAKENHEFETGERQRQREEHAIEVSRLSDQLLQAQREHAKEKEDTAEHLENLESQVAKLGEMADQVPQLEQNLREARKKHTKEVEALQEKHKAELLGDAAHALMHSEEIALLDERAKDLETSLKTAQQQNVDGGKEISRWKDTVAKLELTVNDLMESEAQTAETCQQKLDLLQTENKRLTRSVEELERDMRELEQENDQLSSSLSAQTAAAERDSSLLKKAERKLKRSQDENQMLRTTCQELQEEVSKMNLNSEESLTVLKSVHTMAMSELDQKHEAHQEKAQAEIRECRTRIDELTRDREIANEIANQQQEEILQLRRKLDECEQEKQSMDQMLRDLKQEHIEEVKALSNHLEAANAESQVLSNQTTVLASSLEEVNALHEDKTGHWEAEIARLEEENVALREQARINLSIQEHITEGLEKYQKEMSCAVVELRGDIASVREAVSAPDRVQEQEAMDRADVAGLKRSLDGVESNIFDALAEVTLETENLIECRNSIQTLVDRLSSILEPSTGLRKQMTSLEGKLARVLDKDFAASDESSKPLTACMAELMNVREQLAQEQNLRDQAERSLDRRAEQLMWEKEGRQKAERRAADWDEQAEQLAFERKMRARAEAEIVTLNDQADAYGEEVMRLQGLNRKLEETVKDAEHRIAAALGSTETATAEAVPIKENGQQREGVVDHPMLDEALALAQNLTALMQDQDDTQRETSVMEMLEKMNNEMDKPPIQQIDIPVGVVATPEKNNKVDEDDEDEDPPAPIASPPLFPSDAKSGELTMVVEQLYARCQMLERERYAIMDTTMDILHSAKEASKAELEAALATARRKSADELLKAREENQKNMWRLYHRLCGTCQHDLVKDDVQDESQS